VLLSATAANGMWVNYLPRLTPPLHSVVRYPLSMSRSCEPYSDACSAHWLRHGRGAGRCQGRAGLMFGRPSPTHDVGDHGASTPTLPHGVRCSPAPTRGAGSSLAHPKHASGRLDLGAGAPARTNALARVASGN
jgi:hypothetical protein